MASSAASESLSIRNARASGCARADCHRFSRADQQPGLRATEQLVRGAADHLRSGLDRSADRRLIGEERNAAGLREHSRANVVDDGNPKPAELLDRDLLDETDRAEVRRMDPQDCHGLALGRRATAAS